jgi:hypothetical protein
MVAIIRISDRSIDQSIRLSLTDSVSAFSRFSSGSFTGDFSASFAETPQ